MDRTGQKTALRRFLALVVFAFFAYWSVILAGLLGWSTTPRGPHRLTGHWHLPLLAIGAGVLGVALASRILGRRVLSPWLLLAVLPAAYFILVETGVV
ncbi:hypothetical protein GCM10022243_28390 [Saccharothrix violaceirubra]|uniref:Uncharacterized protein n=1 Tax=Saccharothrix violaceirubra TaxID=413306 RepID=A0A7W7TA23_9PSEU|nr:hypothetical protein [Saccharothrix violaceirubra]MBB4969236.1 hypothetical protein [Saccharothrix violaceirubra]